MTPSADANPDKSVRTATVYLNGNKTKKTLRSSSPQRIVEWKGINEPHAAMRNVEKNSAAMIRPVKDESKK
jgi:hypothetical protein